LIDVDRLKQLLELLHARIDSTRRPLSFANAQQAGYSQTSFVDALDEALDILNNSEEFPHDVNKTVRSVLADLTRMQVLPSALAWPRRYLYQMSYRRESDPPHQRFIYRALNAQLRIRGLAGGLDDPAAVGLKTEVESKFRDFYAIRPNAGWAKNPRSTAKDSGEAAFELARLLIRVFFVEGLAVELLDAFRRYEQILYFAREKYRDHYSHVVYDFLLGCRILDGLEHRVHENWSIYSTEIPTDEYYVRTMRSWLIASLFHDIGYAAEILGELRDQLQDSFFSHVPGFRLSELKLTKEEHIKDEVRDFLELLSLVFKEDEYSFSLQELGRVPGRDSARYDVGIFSAMGALFHDQLEQLDHGVASALFLLLTLKVDTHEIAWQVDPSLPFAEKLQRRDEWRASFRKRREEAIEDIMVASLAIALHNIRQTAYRGLTVDFRTHPIAWTLMLCDDLHQWDRKADWERTQQALTAVYGFNVYPRLSSPAGMLDKDTAQSTLDGAQFRQSTFLVFLLDRVKIFAGVRVSADHQDVRFMLSALEAELQNHEGESNETTCRALRAWLKEQRVPQWVKVILDVALITLTSDVITFTYVGGDVEKGWAEQDNRMRDIWQTFETLYSRNLANGPAICVLHGYDEDNVRLFFVAEYDEYRKEYVVDARFPELDAG
jgi:hypothetical protein